MSCTGDFLNLLFPRLCPACENVLLKNEGLMCTACTFGLPRTRFRSYRDNAVARLFQGRVTIENATAYFHYQKGSRYRKLIHDLKYKGRKDIGRELGRIMGLELLDSPYAGVNLILPVPLHPARLRQRGYNQCDSIAEGLSRSLGIPHCDNLLVRSRQSGPQTGKSRYQRRENAEPGFGVKMPPGLENMHILLVDDVVTTGATLGACATAVLNVPGTRVSVAALAYTGKLF